MSVNKDKQDDQKLFDLCVFQLRATQYVFISILKLHAKFLLIS